MIRSSRMEHSGSSGNKPRCPLNCILVVLKFLHFVLTIVPVFFLQEFYGFWYTRSVLEFHSWKETHVFRSPMGKQRLSETREGVFCLLPCCSAARGVPPAPACVDGGPGGAQAVMCSRHTPTAPSGGRKPRTHARSVSSLAPSKCTQTSGCQPQRMGKHGLPHGLTALGSGFVSVFMFFWTSWEKRHGCFPPSPSSVHSCEEKHAQDVGTGSEG